jgi:hypothetical protein
MTSRYLPDVLRGDRGRPGSPGPVRSTFPFVTYVDPNSTSIFPPDGSYANPFLTVDSAIAALDADALGLAEYVVMLAPATYSGSSVVPTLVPDRNYRFIGLTVSETVCRDWIVTGTTGTLTFVGCKVSSTGAWTQVGYNLTFVSCTVDLHIVTSLVVPLNGLVRFTDSVGNFGGATIQDSTTWVELDSRSKWGLYLPPFTVPFVGNLPRVRDCCAFARSNFEFWCDSNFPRRSQTDRLGGLLVDGTVSHPFAGLADCLTAIDSLVLSGEVITTATIHLAPSPLGYVIVPPLTLDPSFATRLCIIGDGRVRDCMLGQFSAAGSEVEIRNCYVLSGRGMEFYNLELHHCVVDSDLTVNTTLEMTTSKVECSGGLARTYAALSVGQLWGVDSFTDYMTAAPVPLLVNLTKEVRA